jgi:hypothetical protein
VGVWGTSEIEGDTVSDVGEWQPDADGDGASGDGDDLDGWLDGIVDQAMGKRGKGRR